MIHTVTLYQPDWFFPPPPPRSPPLKGPPPPPLPPPLPCRLSLSNRPSNFLKGLPYGLLGRTQQGSIYIQAYGHTGKRINAIFKFYFSVFCLCTSSLFIYYHHCKSCHLPKIKSQFWHVRRFDKLPVCCAYLDFCNLVCAEQKG